MPVCYAEYPSWTVPPRRRPSMEIAYVPLYPASSYIRPLSRPAGDCIAYLSPLYPSSCSASSTDHWDELSMTGFVETDVERSDSRNESTEESIGSDNQFYSGDNHLYGEAPGDCMHTTLMVRNIARTSTQEDLVDALNSSGFRGTYDFAYLPFRALKKRNLGFAFVNFKTHTAAMAFYERWHRSNTFAHRGKRSRHVTISVAKIQGIEENVRLIEQTANDKYGDMDHRPVAFVGDSIREFTASI